MFQLTPDETECLLLQIAIAKTRRGDRRNTPYVFTEHGVAMLSSVLNSERAVQDHQGSVLDVLAVEIEQLRNPPLGEKHRIGFVASEAN
jgi:hypothetical protein